MRSSAAARLDVAPMSRLFKALGDDTRLRLVALLAHGELCVCHLEQALGLTQPTASRHLGVLRNAGVVAPRRAGKWVYYRLADPGDAARRQQLQALVAGFAAQRVLRQDVARLRQARGIGPCA